MPTDVVVVSPHLDDAVLSATLQLLRPGSRLVTVCTAEPPATAPPGEWDRLTRATCAAGRVRERLAEDDAALALLGHHESVRLGFPDGQHVAAADRPTQAALVAALAPHLAGVTEVWAPAGIGCHPDHLATREAAVEAAEPGAMVHFYADVPYSLRYGWPPSVTGRPARPYLDVEVWLEEELAATGLSAADLARTVHRLSPADQRRKSAAMACYATQIPALDYDNALADGDPAAVAFEVSWSRS